MRTRHGAMLEGIAHTGRLPETDDLQAAIREYAAGFSRSED
jgi:hypothetical protein